MILPQEILDSIMLYTTFRQCLGVSGHAAHKLFDYKQILKEDFYKHISIHMIKWLHLNEKEGWLYYALHSSAKSGNMDIIKYILHHYPDVYIVGALDRIPACGNLDTVKWLYEKYTDETQTRDSMYFAILGNNLDIAKYIYRKDIEYTDNLIADAIYNNNLDFVKYFTDLGIKLTRSIAGTYYMKETTNIIKFLYLHYKSTNDPSIEYLFGDINCYVMDGWLDLIRVLYDHGEYFTSQSTMLAAKHGYLEIFKFLYEKNIPVNEYAFMEAAENGHIKILEFIIENKILEITDELAEKALLKAVAKNHKDIMYYIYDHYECYNEYLLHKVIASNNLDFLKFLDEESLINDIPYLLNKESLYIAVKNGNLGIIKYLYDETIIFEEPIDINRILIIAMENKHHDIVDWIINNLQKYFKKFNYEVLTIVVKYGYLKIVKILYDLEIPFDKKIFEIAVRFCHLEIIDWLYNKDIVSEDYDLNNAIRNNRLDILKLLYDYNLKIPNKTFQTAIYNCNLDIAKWLYKHRIYLNDVSIEHVIKNGHINIANWLCEVHISQRHIAIFICYAAKNNHFDIIKKYYQPNLYSGQRTNIFDIAVISGNLEMLKWLYDNKAAPTPQAFYNAAENGYYHILKFLREIDAPEHRECLSLSIKNRNFEVVKWLYESANIGIAKYNLRNIIPNIKDDDENGYIKKWLKHKN